MLGRKKNKKKEKVEPLFKREAYIPKATLNKKERAVPTGRGKQRGEDAPQKSVGRKALVVALWLCFVGEVVYVLFFAGFFAITNWEIAKEGQSNELKNEVLQEFLQAPRQGKYLGMIPKNNILFLQPYTEEHRLRERYPKIETVTVTKRLPHTVQVAVTEKPYQILWCSKGTCFVVNKEGVTESADTFFQYPEEQGKVVRIEDTAEEGVALGQEVVTPEDQEFVRSLSTDFGLRTGLEIEGSWERPNAQAEEMRIQTNKGFQIYFNTRLPVMDSLNTLMLVLQKEIPEDEWKKIRYIDLRTENRIYYTREDRAPEKTEAQKQREEEQEKKRKEEEEGRKSQ